MSKDTLINFRINQDLKEDFQATISSEGFTMSQAIEAFMKEVVHRGFIPLSIKARIQKARQPILTIPFIKMKLAEVLKNYDTITDAYLFGSYSLGTATPKSDVDIYIEGKDNLSLFELGQLENELSNAFGKEVDLVTKSNDEYLMSVIGNERIKLYERRS